MNKLNTAIRCAALATVLVSVAACGGSGTHGGFGNQNDLVSAAITEMEDGDYEGLVNLCSPLTRGEAAAAILFAKALDPQGNLLKAAAATAKAEVKRGNLEGAFDGEAPVQYEGRWYMDCSE